MKELFISLFNSRSDTFQRTNRILVSFVVVLVFLNLLFRFVPKRKAKEIIFSEASGNGSQVTMLEMPTTIQAKKATAPKRPTMPIIAPEYEISDEEIEISDENYIDADLDDFISKYAEGSKSNGAVGTVVSNPSRPPNVLKIVEPTLPAKARDNKIKAEITVRFLVTNDGEVKDVQITDRYIYDNKEKKLVKIDSIGFGVEEATLDAAKKWRFRAAKHKGEYVTAYTTQIFSFGL